MGLTENPGQQENRRARLGGRGRFLPLGGNGSHFYQIMALLVIFLPGRCGSGILTRPAGPAGFWSVCLRAIYEGC